MPESLFPQYLRPISINAGNFFYNIGPFQPGRYAIKELYLYLAIHNNLSNTAAVIFILTASGAKNLNDITFADALHQFTRPNSAILFDSATIALPQTKPRMHRFPLNYKVILPNTYINFLVADDNGGNAITGFAGLTLTDFEEK